MPRNAKQTKQPKHPAKQEGRTWMINDLVKVDGSDVLYKIMHINASGDVVKLSHGGGSIHPNKLKRATPGEEKRWAREHLVDPEKTQELVQAAHQEQKAAANGSTGAGEYTAKVIERTESGLDCWVRIKNGGPVDDYLVKRVTATVFVMTKLGGHHSEVYNVFIGQTKMCGCDDFKHRGNRGDGHECKHIKSLTALRINNRI